MKKLPEYIIIFCMGAIIYSAIEILFRGFTHWTMALTGGFAFLMLYIINIKLIAEPFLKRCAIGSLVITGIEFVVGYIVNIVLKMNIWNYSERPLHILGQVCPLFTFLWFLLCIPASLLCMLIYKEFSKNQKMSNKNIIMKSKKP